MTAHPTAASDVVTVETTGVDLCFESFGDPGDPTLLMVMGLGAQMIGWPEEFIAGFVDRGFRVIRFDNRDVGLSSKFDDDSDPVELLLSLMSGDQRVAPPYQLEDMAADAVGLLDALDVSQAHVLGASMGGMIAQCLAIHHRDRVTSLTSIMSTTGDPEVGQPEPSVLGELLTPAPTERDAFIEYSVRQAHVIGSPDLVDEAMVRVRAARLWDRGVHPQGVVRQLLAIIGSPPRSDGLRSIELPALVVHGDADPLVTPSGGQRTHECLADSELLVIPGMGHDLPAAHWPQIIESVTGLAARTASR
ncbi:MAG: alpha/beta hydrolase [Acidimicrobiia bacterium]|nr:alpha/beta hydrolase [Acidimicrobiia bacterium]